MVEPEVASEATDEPLDNGPAPHEGTSGIVVEKKEERNGIGEVEGEAKEEEKKSEDVKAEEEDDKKVEGDGEEGLKMEEGEDGLTEGEKTDEKAEESKEEKVLKSRRGQRTQRGQRGKAKKKEVVSEEKKGEMKKREADKKNVKESDVKEGKEMTIEEEGVAEGVEMEKETDKKVEKENKEVEEKAEHSKKDKAAKKRRRGQNAGEKDEVKKKKEVGEKKVKESVTPVASSLIDRPVRERKSVERLVAVIEKEAVKEFLIEKGPGTPLKDIPNVAYKLSKRKTDDVVKMLHSIIFGRRGKASQFKSNIAQFSGFVWHENEEKQRAKIKERLDKCVKDKLVDICDMLDIPISKATVRKEDLVLKLLDFLVAPCATTDILLAEKDQSSTAKKRKRTVNRSASKSPGSTLVRRSAKKQRKVKETPKREKKSTEETEDEEEVEEDEEIENGMPDADEDEDPEHSESEKKEDESDEEYDEDSGKGKQSSKKSSKRGSAGKVKTKKAPPATPTKTSAQSSSKVPKADDTNNTSPKVFSRKKKSEDKTPKQSSTPLKSAPKSKAGKEVAKGKGKPKKESDLSDEELRKATCEILKEVDYNTATFTDILKLLARRFNTDLTSRKPALKAMIREELTKIADEAEDDQDDEDEPEKGENSEPADQEAEA